MGYKKCVVEMGSGGTTYIQSFMKTGRAVQAIISLSSTICKAVMLVLLMGRIHDVCCWDEIRRHDIGIKFHDKRFRNLSNITVIASTI
jgi:hypothetical protein